MVTSGWIGVDLDGTLAEYHGWNTGKIGVPIPKMMSRVRDWLSQGITVKIFTARAQIPEDIPNIKVWLAENGLPELEVTNVKDFAMVELWDDMAIQVIPNTGEVIKA